MDRPAGRLYHPADDILVTLRATGVLKEPAKGKEAQSVQLIRDIKASGELPPELVAAWRTKGFEADASSTYEPRLFCSHALTRRILKKWARNAGLREGEIDLIADDSMWKRNNFPIRMRPVAGPEEFRSKVFPHPVPFTSEEVAFFLGSGPCSLQGPDTDCAVRELNGENFVDLLRVVVKSDVLSVGV